jgi:copper(I)-binding protein
MVSRQTTRPLRKLVPAVAIGVSALLGIVGCGAGQVAQTAEMEPAVNGNSGQVGDLMLRDVMVAFPESGRYEAGDDAPLLLTIVNVGSEGDELVGVTSPAGEVEQLGNPKLPGRSALQVVLPGENAAASTTEETTTTTTTEGSETSGSETSGSETSGSETSGSETSGSETSATGESASSAVTPTSVPDDDTPDVVGTISLVIRGLTGPLPFGKTVPVTFEFANAGRVTINLPVAAPSTPRPEATVEEEGH